MSKIMVTGARGFLARHLISALETSGYKVVPVTHDMMELTDPESVMKAVEGCRPDYVVHCAAIAATGYCAEHPDESFAVNAQGPANLAKACREFSAGLIAMSSDQVYAGCQVCGPLPESLPLEPSNVYGRDKLRMESMVLEQLPSALVLRLPWMFEEYNEQNPHVDIMSRFHSLAESGESMKASTRELRGISDVEEICANIIQLIEKKVPGGVYNFGSGNTMTTYETMVQVAPLHGVAAEHIIPDDSWGRNLSMDCAKLESFGISFRNTADALTPGK